jgi:hypothetical protein
LLRFRRKLVESRITERNRVLKVLEVGNVKLSAVATDVFGVSGMLILRAPGARAGEGARCDGWVRRQSWPPAAARDGAA